MIRQIVGCALLLFHNLPMSVRPLLRRVPWPLSPLRAGINTSWLTHARHGRTERSGSSPMYRVCLARGPPRVSCSSVKTVFWLLSERLWPAAVLDFELINTAIRYLDPTFAQAHNPARVVPACRRAVARAPQHFPGVGI